MNTAKYKYNKEKEIERWAPFLYLFLFIPLMIIIIMLPFVVLLYYTRNKVSLWFKIPYNNFKCNFISILLFTIVWSILTFIYIKLKKKSSKKEEENTILDKLLLQIKNY